MKRIATFGLLVAVALVVGAGQELLDPWLLSAEVLQPLSEGDCDGNPANPICCFAPWLC